MLKAIQSLIHKGTFKQEPPQVHDILLLLVNTKGLKEQACTSVLIEAVTKLDHQFVPVYRLQSKI